MITFSTMSLNLDTAMPEQSDSGIIKNLDRISPFISTNSAIRECTESAYETSWKVRPQSTPSPGLVYGVSPGKMSRRPKTAISLPKTADCMRMHQVEHEPTRRHNLENHIPVRKARPPPWQRNIDNAPLVPYLVGPGYILSKSKTKLAMTIRDELFEPAVEVISDGQKPVDERDKIIAQLQQQISDLTLFLEEERLNHRLTKQRDEETLKEKLEEAHILFNDHLRETEEELHEAMDKLKASMQAEFSNYKETAEQKITKLEKEVAFLQGTFKTYKLEVTVELDKKWAQKEMELRDALESQKEAALFEQRQKFMQEKNQDKTQIRKERQSQVEALERQHKKEMETVMRRFSTAIELEEQLAQRTEELEETKVELQHMMKSYNEACVQLTKITRQLTDTKVKLLEFEEQFQEKVAAIDEKYRKKLHDLMRTNTELRQMYVKKCGELMDEKASTDTANFARVQSAKEAMHILIQAKRRAEVSLSSAPLSITDDQKIPKKRPSSAPITKQESHLAHCSAGETHHLQAAKEDYIKPDFILPPEDPAREQLRAEVLSYTVKIPTKEDVLKIMET